MRMTEPERMVYAAAFAAACVTRRPSDTQGARASAWVAVLHLRGDEKRLVKSVDWEDVNRMHRDFTRKRAT